MSASSSFRFPALNLGKGRLEALTDGIFAIVMTLLVLDLRVPDLPRHVPQAELLAHLTTMLPSFFSFALTFVLCAVFWLFHHMLFHFVHHVTRALTWLNIGFLFFVSLLPFSSAMFGHFPSLGLPMVFYWGNQLMLAFFLRLQWFHAQRAGIISSETDPKAVQRMTLRLTIFLAGYAAATITAFWQARLSADVFVVSQALPLVFLRFKARRTAAGIR